MNEMKSKLHLRLVVAICVLSGVVGVISFRDSRVQHQHELSSDSDRGSTDLAHQQASAALAAADAADREETNLQADWFGALSDDVWNYCQAKRAKERRRSIDDLTIGIDFDCLHAVDAAVKAGHPPDDMKAVLLAMGPSQSASAANRPRIAPDEKPLR